MYSLRVSSYIDFKVRREYIHKWLVFLKKWSPAYRHIVISEENLLSLSEDVSIYDQLPSRVVNGDEHCRKPKCWRLERGCEEARTTTVQYLSRHCIAYCVPGTVGPDGRFIHSTWDSIHPEHPLGTQVISASQQITEAAHRPNKFDE
jgi:hypothetical protein